jgi:hypothetical protein
MAGFTINQTFSQFLKRAERSSQERLVSTFVGIDNLVAALNSSDHRIIFGRRGTGKTHALSYIVDAREKAGDHATLIDLRTIGSDQSIYSDQTRTVSERATRLLVDVLGQIHDALTTIAVEHAEKYDLANMAIQLDRLAEAITATKVVGDVTEATAQTESKDASRDSRLSMSLNPAQVEMKADAGASQRETKSATRSRSATGKLQHSIIFGDVLSALRDIVACLGGKRFWIMLDEWSSLPHDLQPYLADLIRRCVFPINAITVQIAAIEQRCDFVIHGSGGAYVGIELGADVSADVNLDDFMVFDNDAERAKRFFKSFLFNHFEVVEGKDESVVVKSADDLVRQTFTDIRAFEEFVRAVEGVPRDAMNIISLAALKAGSQPISVQMVRVAARDWYSRDKANVLNAKPELNDLLQWVMHEVIENRRARAFLLRSDQKDEMIDDLFDARLLHILKKAVAAHDRPGVRYLVYKLDYGCYVDLLVTAKAPGGLLASDENEGFIEVPPDDYRAIRRAILDIDEFKRTQTTDPT